MRSAASSGPAVVPAAGSAGPAQLGPLGPVPPSGLLASQAGTPSIEGSLTYDSIMANGFTSFGSVTFTIRQSPGGTVLATGTKAADGGGHVQFNRWQDHYVDLAVGMQITATDGSTTKDLTLVLMSVTTVNMTTNVVTGTAPASWPVHVDVGGGSSWTGSDTTADGTGHWSVNLSPFQITPDMQAIAKVSDLDGDMTSYGKQPARVDGSLTQDSVSANGFTPNGSVAFTIRQSPGGTVLASGQKPTDDQGSAQFNRNQDHSVDLKAGMQLTASDGTVTKNLTLVALVITSVDPATDDVSGTAPSGSPVQVNVSSPGSWANGQATADGSGHWTIDFTGAYDITYTTSAGANVADADGDQTQAQRGVAQISASLTGDGIQAMSFAANASVTFTIRQSPAGPVLASGTRPTDDQGNAQFVRPQDHNVDLLPGMQVTVADGTSTKGVTLAGVTVMSVDPATDVIIGTAPADAQVQVAISNVWGVNPVQVTADANGHWSADFTGTFDITFTTQVSASVRDPDGDWTTVEHGVPWIEAWLTGDGVFANGFASNSAVTFTIRQSAGGTVLASGQKPTDDQGNAQFNRNQDHDVDLAPGMLVTVTDGTVTKGLTLVGVTIDSINVATDVVAGTAPADAQVQVDVNDSLGGRTEWVTADPNGNWSADFSGVWDFTYGTSASAHVRDGDGDATVAQKRSPFIDVSLTSDSVQASNFAANGTVTFTIRQSPAGTVLASGAKPTDDQGNAQFNRDQDHGVDLVPGMQVSVSDGTVTKDLTLASLAITSVDPGTDVVAGTAPAGAQVQVNVGDQSGGAGTQVTANGNGHWSASFAGAFDITYATNTNAVVTDPDGDQTSAWKPPTQIQADPSSDNIRGNGFAENASVSFTIRQTPGGTVLASGSTPTRSDGNFDIYRWQDYDIDLQPGMQVTVTDGSITKQLTLVALSIDSVNPATNTVAGTAPAGVDVQVDVGDDQGNGTGQTTTADSSGHWSIDFSPFDVTYTMGANAQVRDEDGDATSFGKGAARIHVALSWDGINAESFAGNADVSFTIRQSPAGPVLATGSRTSDAQGNVEFDRWDAFDIDLVPGMQVTVTDGTLTKQLTLAAVAITSVDPTTDVVAGTAPADAQVDVGVGDDQGNGTGQTTTADGGGHWSIDFSPFDVTYTMGANAQVSDQDGDTTQADGGPTTIDVSLTWDVISGSNFAANTDVTFTIKSSGGAVLASDSRTCDGQGYVEFDRWDAFDVDLMPGMQVTVTDGTTTKQLTLTAVSIIRVDPPSDTVSGTAAAGAEVRVDVGDDQNGTSQTVTADGTGHWSIDFSPFDITYRANASAHVGDSDGDTTTADKNAPQIWSNLTYDNISAQGFASDASISFTIRQSPGGAVLAQGSGTSDAAGQVDFYRGDAFDVDLLPGMQVTVSDGTATKQLTLAVVGITHVDPVTDTVSGTAAPGAEIQVDVGDDQGNGMGQMTTADDSGHWSIDFSPFDITYRTNASAHVSDHDGDTTSADKNAPQIWSNLVYDNISAQGFASDASVSFTIRQTPGGAVLATGSGTSDAAGNIDFSRGDAFDVDLLPGMQVTVSDGTATKQLTLAALGITHVDPSTETVSGTAAAGAEIQVGVGDGQTGTGQLTTADGSGHWSIDFSPFDITYTMNASANVTDSDSDTTAFDKSAPRMDVEVTSDVIRAQGFASNASVSFTIRQSPGGTVLASGSRTSDAGGSVELARGDAFTVDLLSGMQITLTDGTLTKSLTLAAIAVTSVDPATNVVAGTAAPNAIVHVNVGDMANGAGQDVTADGSGHWSADFSPFDITPTMTANAGTDDSDSDTTWTHLTADTTPPVTTIVSGPSGLTNDSTPTFTFSANEPSTFECKVDSGSWASCTSPYTTAVLTDGAHTLQVRATDTAGNVGAPVSRSFTVDTVAPQTTIDSGPTGVTNDSTPTFGFSSEAGATFECKVDSGGWASCTSPYTLSTLADGAHTFEVRATDAAGNTDGMPASRGFTVDTVAPGTSIDTGPRDPLNELTATFTFSSNETGASFECKVDSAGFAACTSPYTTGVLADGSHTFQVRATDPAGNTDQTPASRSFTVDTTAPVTTINSGPSGLTNDSTPTFTFSASEPVTFKCGIDAGPLAPCSSPYTLGVLADGLHQIEIVATDAASNTGTPAYRQFTVDTVAPQTTIDSGPSGPTNDSTPTFAFSSEAGAIFECKVDSGSWASCTSPHTTVVLADGAHTLQVRATDAAGNVDATPASRSFTVDTVAPQTTIDSGPSGPTNDSTPTFGFSSDAGATFECKVDSGSWASCTSPHTTVVLADGAHTLQVRATDAAGNVDTTPASRSFTVDTVAPQATIDSGPSGPTNDSTPTFGFSANESAAFECRIDSGNWTVCTSPYTAAVLVDGAHTFQVRATDAANNLGTAVTRSFTVDTVAPQTTIDSGPTGVTNDSTPTFGFSSEAGATFECKVDSGSWTACTSPYTTAVLADAAHTLQVRATDAAGNVDATPASRSFTVDTVAPQTTIDSGPSGPTNDSTPTFAFSSEAGATFECKVDSGGWASCSSPYTTALLSDGAHTFQVRATDAVGNVDATPASRSFTVDTLAPQTTIDSGPTGVTNDSTPTFGFSANESAAFECRIDSGNWTVCTSPYTTAVLADATHTLQVRATDAAGNVDATPASRSFTVDTLAPQTTIDSGPSGPTNDSMPTFGFSSEAGATFECKVDSGSWASCTSPYTTAVLTDGAHTLQVRATDAAGNVDATPASRSFTVDTVAPQATIDSGPSGVITSPTATFTFSASEPSTFECKIDSSSWAPCSSPFTTDTLADGAYTFQVRAIDTVGNLGAAASRTFTVDATDPETTILSGPSGTITDTTPTFTFEASEAASFECRLDGGAFVACTSPYTTPTLALGAHVFEVRAIDAATNVDPTPASRSFTVARERTEVTVLSRTVTVSKKHVAAIRMRCGKTACHGTGTLRVTVRSHGHTSKLQIGRKFFSIAAGRTAMVNIKLTAKGYRLLVQKRKLAAKMKCTYRQPTGGTSTDTASITLKAPKR